MTQTSAQPVVRNLAVPGATLQYEVRGDGPVLAVIGSPMTASEFAAVADALAPWTTAFWRSGLFSHRLHLDHLGALDEAGLAILDELSLGDWWGVAVTKRVEEPCG